jgi:hypothetical protein
MQPRRPSMPQVSGSMIASAFSTCGTPLRGKIALESETTVFEAGRSYKELARNPIEGTCQASPAVSGGEIIIRSDKRLFCINDR